MAFQTLCKWNIILLPLEVNVQNYYRPSHMFQDLLLLSELSFLHTGDKHCYNTYWVKVSCLQALQFNRAFMRRLSVWHIFQITDFCLSVARTSICSSTVRWGDSGRSSMQWPIMDPLQLPHNLYFSGQFHTFVTLCIISACHIMIGTTAPYLPACLSICICPFLRSSNHTQNWCMQFCR